MKLTFLLLISFGLLTGHAMAQGAQAIIKQRAKELSNQNNVRQGVPAPGTAPASQQPAPTAAQPVATPTARLQADLAAIKPNSTVTPGQRQKVTTDLIGLADGKKPGVSATAKLAQDMTAALSQKAPSEGARNRLVQDLKAAMNPANLPASQMQDIVSDVQAVFQTSGIARKDAVVIADDLKAITAELHAAK